MGTFAIRERQFVENEGEVLPPTGEGGWLSSLSLFSSKSAPLPGFHDATMPFSSRLFISPLDLLCRVARSDCNKKIQDFSERGPDDRESKGYMIQKYFFKEIKYRILL